MVRRHRSQATASDEGHRLPLGLHATPRLGVIRGDHKLLLTGTHLQSESALAGFGKHHPRIEPDPDLVPEAKAIQPARSQHNSVEPPLAALP